MKNIVGLLFKEDRYTDVAELILIGMTALIVAGVFSALFLAVLGDH